MVHPNTGAIGALVVRRMSNGNGHDTVEQSPRLRQLATSILDRFQFFRQAGITFKGMRDLYEILGYERILTTIDYRDRYARGGIAGRIVEALPKATWRGDMEIVEDEDPKNKTPFEQAWYDLEIRLKIKAVLQRADILSQLGYYSVVLIGAPGDFSDELPRGTPDKLLYLSPFSGGGGPGIRSGANTRDAGSGLATSYGDAIIQAFDTDTTSPRFGLPMTYQLRRIDVVSPDLQRPVHWSRIIHLAEGCLDNEVYGQPRLERVWNLLDDLDKVTGGGAEAFWLRANAGLQLDVAKDMTLSQPEIDALKDQADEYQHQIRRMLRTRGVTVTPLTSQTADFQNPTDAIITQIAGALSIPKRILTGSEMGELASSQDRDNWKDQINGRQVGYAEPYIVRPLIDRLVTYGYLPEPAAGKLVYEVQWPHIQTLTEQEKAEGAAKWASVNATAKVTVFSPDEIRDKWYGLDPLELKDTGDTESFKADGARAWAMVNKIMGITVFTDDEIRLKWYGFKPLTEAQKAPPAPPAPAVQPGAPVVPGTEVVPPGTPKLGLVPKPGDVAAIKAAVESLDMDLLQTLTEAIETNDTATIDRIIGTRHPKTLQDGPHKFASTQIQLPPPIADKLLAFGNAIPDDDLNLEEGGRETDAHVTVKYGIHDDDPGPVIDLLDDEGSIFLTMGVTDYFSHDGYDVLFVRVDSPDLEQLNELISTALDVTDTYPDYHPHATIAYLKPGLGPKYANQTVLAGMTATIGEVTFSSSDGEKVVLRTAGDQSGHDFHGNQWTSDVEKAPEGNFKLNETTLHDEHSSEREFQRAIRTQYPNGLVLYHETDLENAQSIKENGMYDDQFARIGKPSDFVLTPDKTLVEIRLSPRDSLRVSPDQRYDPNNSFADLLRQHNGVHGADVSLNQEILPSQVRVITRVGGKTRQLGDESGHPFHGNQWTNAAREERIKEINQEINRIVSQGGNSARDIKQRMRVIDPLVAEQDTHKNILDPTRHQAIIASAKLTKNDAGGFDVKHQDATIGTLEPVKYVGFRTINGAQQMKTKEGFRAKYGDQVVNSQGTRKQGVEAIARAHSDKLKGRALGDQAGHDFHGNQWGSGSFGLPPSTDDPAPGGRYMYHATHVKNLSAIAEKGLVSQQRGLVSLSPHLNSVHEWSGLIGNANQDTAVLRTPRTGLNLRQHDQTDPSDAYHAADFSAETGTYDSIPANHLEVYHDGRWKSLTTKLKGLGDEAGHDFHGNQWTVGTNVFSTQFDPRLIKTMAKERLSPEAMTKLHGALSQIDQYMRDPDISGPLWSVLSSFTPESLHERVQAIQTGTHGMFAYNPEEKKPYYRTNATKDEALDHIFTMLADPTIGPALENLLNEAIKTGSWTEFTKQLRTAADAPLTEAELTAAVANLEDGWQILKEGLARRFEFVDRRACASFIARLMRDANIANHHPEVSTEPNAVIVTFVTHSAGDQITALDIQSAHRADQTSLAYRTAGDVDGHPFHGNQWAPGEVGIHGSEEDVRATKRAIMELPLGVRDDIEATDIHIYSDPKELKDAVDEYLLKNYDHTISEQVRALTDREKGVIFSMNDHDLIQDQLGRSMKSLITSQEWQDATKGLNSEEGFMKIFTEIGKLSNPAAFALEQLTPLAMKAVHKWGWA